MDYKYLIKHCNISIEIENKMYFANEITENKPLLAILQPISMHIILEDYLGNQLRNFSQMRLKNFHC